MRAGRGEQTTGSIKNAINQGWIKGEVTNVPFADRHTSNLIKELKNF